MKNNVCVLLIIILVCSCTNKKSAEKYAVDEQSLTIETIDVKVLFDELNKNMPQEIKSIEYYKNKILQDVSSRRYLELNDIMQIENLIPGFICFMVRWTDFEGYVYKLYSFDNSQLITDIYHCGNGWPFPYSKILTQNIPGSKIGDFLFVSDINNDGINEILSFSFSSSSYITIYGFDAAEYKFKKHLETDFYFNYDKPFAPVKINNSNDISEIIVFEITDEETLDFEWVKYTYNKEKRIYKRNFE